MKTNLILFLLLAIAIGGGALGYLVAPRPQSHADFYAPAISEDGQGTLVKFRISLLSGTGRTLVNIQNAKYREDTENALLKAKKNAETLLGVKLEYYDTVLDIESIGSEVGGESAGAMFTVGIIAAYSGKNVKKDTVMSAGITEEGLLFAVDGIEEKILAAQNSGKDKFIVANSQEIKHPENMNGVEIIRAKDIREATQQIIS
ncbi:MAG: S16 family serine protease [Candidatus Micrarchaeota archaeon]